MNNASFKVEKFDLVTAETIQYHREVETIKSITSTLKRSLLFSINDAIEKGRIKHMDSKARKQLLEGLNDLKCAVEKSSAMLEQSTCLMIPNPLNQTP